MSWYDRRRKFTIFDAIILGVIVIFMVVFDMFQEKQYIHCIKGVDCKIYSQQTMFSRKTLAHKFKQQDISHFKTKEHKHTHRGKHQHHYTKYTYSPIIYLKNDTQIDLDTIEFSNEFDINTLVSDMQTKRSFKKSPPSLLLKLFMH